MQVFSFHKTFKLLTEKSFFVILQYLKLYRIDTRMNKLKNCFFMNCEWWCSFATAPTLCKLHPERNTESVNFPYSKLPISSLEL